MKINVMYLIEDLQLGGAERVVVDLARSLDKTRFNVSVCCLRTKGQFAYLLETENIPVFELNKRPKLDLSVIFKIKKVLKDNDIHIVHTHLWVANFWGRIAAKLAGVPHIVA